MVEPKPHGCYGLNLSAPKDTTSRFAGSLQVAMRPHGDHTRWNRDVPIIIVSVARLVAQPVCHRLDKLVAKRLIEWR
jgi:hypothetical protein